MAILARHLIQDFPQEYHYFSTPSFTFGRRVIWNHDHMLQTYPGADGLKTGYTRASGLNLVTSAVRGDVRLIGVVFGAANGVERDIHMASLLDQGFEKMDVPLQPRHESPYLARAMTSQLGGPRISGVMTQASALALPLPAMPPKFSDTRLGDSHIVEPRGSRGGLSSSRWDASLGTFATEGMARHALAATHHEIGDMRIDPVAIHGHVKAWRVTVTGLSQPEAQGFCLSAGHAHLACSTQRADSGQIASR
jgi:D-alanyl-D-alanine carboxypeptidase